MQFFNRITVRNLDEELDKAKTLKIDVISFLERLASIYQIDVNEIGAIWDWGCLLCTITSSNDVEDLLEEYSKLSYEENVRGFTITVFQSVQDFDVLLTTDLERIKRAMFHNGHHILDTARFPFLDESRIRTLRFGEK